MDYEFKKDKKGKLYLKVNLTDFNLITHPLLNKNTAFTQREREAFHLSGLIPHDVKNLKTQVARAYGSFQSKQTALEKYMNLRDLQDSNETLFYKLLLDHIEEMLPIVYTPTVGSGCQQYSHIYRRPRGLFISYPDRDRIDEILKNPRFDNVNIIVVSDGERILGLGDQGAGGMGIPIGKLSLYSACAGIFPDHTLPILLDSGTNNPDLLNDPLYIGWRHERIRDEEYHEFIDKFITALKKRFHYFLLQWEDFAQQNANVLLNRYRDDVCSFNDDIQGTAAVTLGTLLAAVRQTGHRLTEQRIVVVGAGSAGCGISSFIKKAMIKAGLSEEEASKRFFLVDYAGLLLKNMSNLQSFQKPFAQSEDIVNQWKLSTTGKVTLKDVVRHVHPTLLIGVSGQKGIFSEEIISEMAKYVEHPIIFPLSNPTDLAEATPDDLLKWTHERAIIGTGSPFPPVTKFGKPFRVDQTNNSYIFPGLGLGAIAVKAKTLNDDIFMAAAKALAACSPSLKNPHDNLLPPLSQIRKVSLKIAVAVAKEAIKTGVAEVVPEGDLKEYIKNLMWSPKYLPYKKS